MIRFVDNTNKSHRRITKNQEIGIEKWRRIKHVFNVYFEITKKLLLVDLSDKVRILLLIKYSFLPINLTLKILLF
jgi:hypothetical protein